MTYYAGYQASDLIGIFHDIAGGIGVELSAEAELVGNLLLFGIMVWIIAFIIKGSYGFSQENFHFMDLDWRKDK